LRVDKAMKKYRYDRTVEREIENQSKHEEDKDKWSKLLDEVWADKKITHCERVLFSQIHSFHFGKEGACWCSNRYFAERWDVSEKQISKFITGLRKKGYVKILLYQFRNEKTGQIEKSRRQIKPVMDVKAREKAAIAYKKRRWLDDDESYCDEEKIVKFKKEA
jgi:hypothetical protein